MLFNIKHRVKKHPVKAINNQILVSQIDSAKSIADIKKILVEILSALPRI